MQRQNMNEEIDGYEEIIKDFLTECSEHLDILDNGFVAIEQNASDRKILSEIFRSIHTIKGGAGMLAFHRLEKLTHAAENLLSLLRDGKLQLNSNMITALLQTVDAVRVMLNAIAQSGSDGEHEYAVLIDHLLQLQTEPCTIECEKAKTDKKKSPSLTSNQEETPVPCSAEQVDCPNESLTETELPCAVAAEDEQRLLPISDASIRINVELLDKLMNLVGELVLSRNQILQFIAALSDSSFIAVSQRLNLITSELQEGVMKTRMQPIGNVWGKFTRVVRDLAATCNKRVNLEMYGKETELDKTLIEAIKDPLTHIVRNSVDHGIESAEIRRQKGKPEEGTISLKAYHEGGHVNIEICDDGAGISAEKVKAKAVEKGLISPEQAARLSERDALNLIFLPGLSTSESVSNISGRGVGMDVVRTNIERINGTIDIQSKPGWSTTLKIKIPLTLAIIPALIITCRGNRYAIPQISLLELVRIEPDEVKKHIQLIKDSPVYKLRGKLLPLVYLTKELELESIPNDQDTGEPINIVILQAGEIQFGLVVDSINDTQEIVVKPLSKLLKNQLAFAGATIMGDGKISLILDVVGLARKADLLASSLESNKMNQLNHKHEEQAAKQTLLLLSSGGNSVLAVPLEKVDRIEEFSVANIESIGAQEVVQYRDSIMPLVNLGQFIEGNTTTLRSKSENNKIQVIVHSDGCNNFGLIVEHVYDIVEGSFALHQQIQHRGVVGTSVIDNKVTEILDIEAIMSTVLPSYSYAKNQSSRVQ